MLGFLPDLAVPRERLEPSERLKLLSADVVTVREVGYAGHEPRNENGHKTYRHQISFESNIPQELPKIEEKVAEVADEGGEDRIVFKVREVGVVDAQHGADVVNRHI